eukprot:CAMPEP_0115715042 /NCGR_PEP_ID=MMETSP0272-20121206/75570_1 /TAXON_ID=71861 /ORGANISM="Scrippsiella trochoidea, Strain CCMP3099" /LENGTH=92 /DNA_ID=CAMNT_0003157245 /DNA_START=232 /DNA_END=510 /DNA_ORIENTATION=+
MSASTGRASRSAMTSRRARALSCRAAKRARSSSVAAAATASPSAPAPSAGCRSHSCDQGSLLCRTSTGSWRTAAFREPRSSSCRAFSGQPPR